jgi:Fungalysin metallopeptidase (M36)/GEVED domain/Dockerin type I domain/Fungalysin/Thermolysin Propeptide Motif/Bacterial Ig domain
MGFRHQMRRLLNQQFSRRPSLGRKSGRTSWRRLTVESLEGRQLMAGLTDDVHVQPFPDFPGNYYPPTLAKTSNVNFLSGPATGDPLTIALGYLQQNGTSYGLNPADVTHAGATGNYADTLDSGIAHVYLQQTYNGLPVLDAVAGVNLMPDGRVIAASANFVSGLAYPVIPTTLTPTITAAEAVDAVATGASLPSGASLIVTAPASGRNQKTTYTNPTISSDPIPTQLVYVPAPAGGVDLAWEVIVHSPDQMHWFDAAVAASGPRAGEVIRVVDWVDQFDDPSGGGTSSSLVAGGTGSPGVASLVGTAAATGFTPSVGPVGTYNVFPQPVQDPLYGNRALVSGQDDGIASPFGWHDNNLLPGVDSTTTSGNNVNASPDPGTGAVAPNGGPNLVFDFPFNPNGAPGANVDAATTNLFYWANLAHDVSYRHGFTEAAGNFQVTNRSSAGLANDPVTAISQFLGPNALNNAFMATPPDGQSPLLAMGLFSTRAPFTDADFDGTVVTHEYTHGISGRLTGGPANAGALVALQSRGMGEGWSDWFALIQTMKSTDFAATPRTSGQWVLNVPVPGPGIRRVPYSFDMSIDPLTLQNFNGDNIPGANFSEVHNAGEIWCSALWDMTWLLINKYGRSPDLYGTAGGQNVAMNLVFQGMKLQPANPSFLQARDAIIAADFALNGGDDYELIWQAFARRGFGMSAVVPGANAILVNAGFDTPPPLAHVTGTVFNDVDGDAKRDTNEPILAGITVYNDANNNSRLDTNETRVTTRPDGSFGMAFVTAQTVTLRQSLSSNFTQTFPENNGPQRFFINSSQIIAGKNFGDIAKPGAISGTKFNDLDGDGIRDLGEPGVSNVLIYVDLNNDGKMSIVEPGAVTDFFGHYTIKDIPPGSTYVVREIPPAGSTNTQPFMQTALPYWNNIVVQAGKTTNEINFGDTLAVDFGDAPATYGTTMARDGARHHVLAGFHLGALEDPEPDGVPTSGATGDDLAGIDDEDGIVFVNSGLTPGTTGTIQATVSTGGNSPGKLQGWVDFNLNGKFDANERVISNLLLGAGTHTVTFNVPSTAQFGPTYARFRYGYEPDLGPTGVSAAGEVEDYLVNILPAVPIANPDVFPRPGDPLIKPNSVDYPLDVLANDTPTVFGPPQIVVGSFPATLPSGSTLRLNATGDRILYTPAPGAQGLTQETFTYQVTDGHSVSAPGLVTVNISLADNIAIDDTYTFPSSNLGDVAASLAVMQNDLTPFPTPNAHIIAVGALDPGDASSNPVPPPPVGQTTATISGTTISINSTDPTLLDFTATAGFQGTVIYKYEIDDDDPSTAPSTRFVTVQVVDGGTFASTAQLQAAGYLAELDVTYTDLQGNPITVVDVGDEFLVKITSQDLRVGGDATNRGVESAYLDLLFNRNIIAPVPDPDATRPMQAITFSPQYTIFPNGQNGVNNAPTAGEINEAGAAHDSTGGGVGTGQVFVFTVRMVAKAPSLAGQVVVGDPADGSATLQDEITVMPNVPPSPGTDPVPIVVPDEQVFLRPTTGLRVLGSGEGEFVNHANPLDVNQDHQVSPVDALLIINDLNATGPRLLSNPTATSPVAMVDVNMDSNLSPGDALMVINYLNAPGAFLASSFLASGGEGEGEAAVMSSADQSGAIDDSMAAMAMSDGSSRSTASQKSSGAVLLSSPAPMTTTESSGPIADDSMNGIAAETTTATIDATTADDLYASLDAGLEAFLSSSRRR